MSFNLVDLVKDQLTEQVTGYIGNMLGGNTKQSTSVLASAIPALLGMFMKSSSTKSGAGALFDMLGKQDDSLLDNLGGMLGKEKADSMIKTGTGSLGSLFGGSKKNEDMLGGIIDSISGSSGADKGTTKSIMGLLTPIILGVIKKQLMGGGKGSFNVGSLVDMFTGQKDNITAAVPKGLNLNFLDDVADNASQATHQAAREGKSLLGKLLPLLLLIAAAWIAYNMFFKGADTHQPATQGTEVVNAMDLGKNVAGTMSSFISTLNGIKDVSSAKAAVSTLTAASKNLGTYANLFNKLPASAKAPIIKLITDSQPQLQAAVEKVRAIPGVGAIIQPVLENLSQNLALFK
ncbi:MAG: DUF937 domain-containing protein [Campylobacterota bacterium]|nr:DUF937 domain-containing protein [Campylobacterota bacterium]